MGGSGPATYLPKLPDTRVMAHSVVQTSANANIGIDRSTDNYYKLRVVGVVYDSTS